MASRAGQNADRVIQAFEKAKDGLKAKIAKGAARVVGITDLLKASDEKWSALGQYVNQHVACVLAARPATSLDGDKLKEPWDELQTCVKHIESASADRLERNKVASVAFADEDAQQIILLRREFDDAFGLFKLNLDMNNFTEVENYLGSLNLDELTESIVTRVKEELVLPAIDALPYAAGASWDPDKVCLPGTRDEMLDRMWNFIHATDGATCAQIFWLVDVAGSGKSAVSHTICMRAKEAGLLVMSFFFDRMSAELNNPSKVVTTMARDLASLDKRIATSMASALERDVSLRSASITRQFSELIAQPSVKALGAHLQPYVFLLDALDEGLTRDEKLTTILSSGVRALPGNFRIIVTSRPMSSIAYAFDNVDHIQRHTINLRGISNQSDMATYMTHRLVEVAGKRRRKLPWPDPALALQLVKKSEGHFLWASAVTDFLGRATNPDRQLDALLSLSGAHNTEARMDQLYTAVLQTCPWEDDEDFVPGFIMYMGTVVAAKEPLTGNALQELHGSSDHPRDIFEKFGSLMTGFDADEEVVKPLHLSLQEYLTLRAPAPYRLVEKEHSRTLAVLCINILNIELVMGISSVDSFNLDDGNDTKIPMLKISDTLHYASRFWPAHLSDVTILSREGYEALQHLLSLHLVRWIKLCVCAGHYHSLISIRNWLHTTAPNNDNLLRHVYASQLASSLIQIAWRLRASGRREEALSAAEDAVFTVRHRLSNAPAILRVDQERDSQVQDENVQEHGPVEERTGPTLDHASVPSTRNSPEQILKFKALANSLNVLTVCLSDMGHRLEALRRIEEAVELHRDAVKSHPTTFIPDLATALNNLCYCLRDLARGGEALDAIEEAVQLRRMLVHDHAEAFTPVLADSLDNLCNSLSDLGRREEALKAGEEAVQLRRVLVQDQPKTYTPVLATALNNLSNCLRDLSRRKEALKTIEEAVQLRRVLVQDHAAAFTPVLASSLNNLSNCLGDLGRREEALNAIEEAVQLYRVLAQKQVSAFAPVLATSLNNLSIRLSDLGRREEALNTIKEAVQLRRMLVQDYDVAFTSVLAESLNNLSNRLGDSGRREEALEAIQEAIQLQRVLVRDQAGAFTPVLATSLNNLSNHLGNLGRSEEALHAIQEAVQLRRVLVQDQAAAFTPDLAMCLNNLSICLGNLGRRDEALKAIEESVQFYRVLVQEQAAAFTPGLARALYIQSIRLSDVDRHQEALTSAQEVHEVYHVLGAEYPAVFNPMLKNSLLRLALVYLALGREDDSRSAAREAQAVQVVV